MLVENLLLAAAGGGVGFALTWLLTALLRGVLAGRLPRVTSPPDMAVAGFTAVLTLLAALFVGMLPALHALRTDPARVLKEAGGGTLPGRRTRSLRNVLVGGQVSLALVLLVAAALMLRSFDRLVRVDPGFVADRVLTWELTLPRPDYPAATDVLAFHASLIERIEAIPGVAAVGAVDKLPFGSRWGCGGFAVEGRPVPQRAEDWPCAESRAITPGYTTALGIPLRRGRLLADADNASAEPVVLVNETFARTTWPDGDAIGQRITWAGDTPGEIRWRTVVGIIGDVRHRGLDVPPLPEVYMPDRQSPDRRLSFVLRAAAGDALRLAPQVRGAVRDLDAILPLRDLRTFDETVSESLSGLRTGTWAVAGLAALALVLAVSGIYGVLAYFVVQRGPEFGVRVALGARERDIARLVLTEGIGTALAGAALGLAISLAATRLMRSILFDVSPTDPVAFAGVTLLMIGVAALASWLPARRALRSDPTTALRGTG
jgi:predicted permease